MTNKGVYFHVLGIVISVLIFLLLSCSQAALPEQNQPKDDIKITDVNSSRVIIESANKRYYIIPFIGEDKPGWDWCASSASCMMFLDPGCGWIDQSSLYDLRWGGPNSGTNVLACINSYNSFHGSAAYVTAAYSAPALKYLARYGFDQVQLFIDVRRDYKTGTYFTVVMYGYDLTNNQVAYWNPHNGISAWVNYSSFLTNLNEGNGVSSYSDYMIGVIPQ